MIGKSRRKDAKVVAFEDAVWIVAGENHVRGRSIVVPVAICFVVVPPGFNGEGLCRCFGKVAEDGFFVDGGTHVGDTTPGMGLFVGDNGQHVLGVVVLRTTTIVAVVVFVVVVLLLLGVS